MVSLVPFVVPITVIQFSSYGMVSSLFSDGCVFFFLWFNSLSLDCFLCIGSIKYVWICSHCCTICNNYCSRYYVLSSNSVELLRVSFSICVTYSVEWQFLSPCVLCFDTAHTKNDPLGWGVCFIVEFKDSKVL